MWINIERLIHSLKTALACLVGFVVVRALHQYLLFDQWIIVTILVVMCAQISVGSVVFKSVIRFIGTCIGSLLAALTLISFGDNNLAFALVIALAGFVFSYFATAQRNYADAGTLGAVTTAIILINPKPTLLLSLERFFEITVGLLIATLISQFVLPIHARKHLRRSQAQALRLLGDFYRNSLMIEPENKQKMAGLDEEIVRSLATQRKLANEAQGELLGSKFEPSRFRQILECEKHILRSIDFLNRMYHDLQVHLVLEKNEEWKQFNQSMADCFNELALRVENPDQTVKTIEVPSLSQLKQKLEEGGDLYQLHPEAKECHPERSEGSAQTPQILREAMNDNFTLGSTTGIQAAISNNINTLFFCLDQLTREVGELAKAVS